MLIVGDLAQTEAERERIDRDPEALQEAFVRYEAFGFPHRIRSQTGLENFRMLASLAEMSGALAFTALQQFVAMGYLREDEPIRCGVAFGHLRNPNQTALRADPAGRIQGVVPWFTGSHLFDHVILGFHDGEEEVYAKVDARDRESFRHEAPMPLMAIVSTRTIHVRVRDLEAPDVRRAQPIGKMAGWDRRGAVWQTPLMVGNAQASLTTILESSVDEDLKARVSDRHRELVDRLESALLGDPEVETAQRLRAEAGAWCVRLARLAAMANGGASLLDGQSAGRVYREALILNLMAQTPEVVANAFRQELA